MAGRTDLKWLIEFASARAEQIFRHTGKLLPMYHAVTAEGEHMIIPQPHDDKDVAVGLIKKAFELKNVDSYCFMGEAWILITPSDIIPDAAMIEQYGLAHHPDRREIIMFQAENRFGDRQSACRFILRPEHGKAKLMPLKMDDMTKFGTSEGRMVGLLKQREK